VLSEEIMSEDHNHWWRGLGLAGTAGLTAFFEEALGALQLSLTSMSPAGSGGPLWMPPVIERSVIERAQYTEAFPQLLGDVRASGHDRATVALAPAVCYFVYPWLADSQLPAARRFDVAGYCYRHEATTELGRFRSFRMREFVAVGPAEEMSRWRDEWVDRCERYLALLGLKVTVAAATDPFFGPAGRVLKYTQLEQGLKFEFQVAIDDSGLTTAIASANRHKEHLGERFCISLADGSVAHSSCMAFGLERIVLALMHAHGTSRADWPDLAAAGAGAA
jgi:seryl-tRNA synthetase